MTYWYVPALVFCLPPTSHRGLSPKWSPGLPTGDGVAKVVTWLPHVVIWVTKMDIRPPKSTLSISRKMPECFSIFQLMSLTIDTKFY